MYLVDVDSAALKAAGLKRLQERPGVLERQAQQPGPEQAPAAAAAGPAGGTQRSGAPAEPVVVVGCGPAGLFAALELAQAGIRVSSEADAGPGLGLGLQMHLLFAGHYTERHQRPTVHPKTYAQCRWNRS